MAESDFRENFFSSRKYRKYTGNRRFADFHRTFSYISLFFTQTLSITMSTIKHGEIVNITDVAGIF